MCNYYESNVNVKILRKTVILIFLHLLPLKATMAAASETGPPVTNGADELVYLEKVFFRIASASTDQELAASLAKYLPAIILKLSSTKADVRKKILEMLVHVNKRVKSNDNIVLPMDALLVQYQVHTQLDTMYN
jgi:proteasome component ECM29